MFGVDVVSAIFPVYMGIIHEYHLIAVASGCKNELIRFLHDDVEKNKVFNNNVVDVVVVEITIIMITITINVYVEKVYYSIIYSILRTWYRV